MNPRIIEFINGVEASPQPDAGTPTDPNDVLTLGYATTTFGKAKRSKGSWASPYVPAGASTSLAHDLTSTEDEGVMLVEAASVGTLDLSNSAQIAAGTKLNQRLVVIATSDTKRIKFEDGNGLSMLEGNAIVTKLGTQLEFHWDPTNSLWRHTSWNNVGDLG